MEQIHPRQTDSRSAGYEIHCIIWNTECSLRYSQKFPSGPVESSPHNHHIIFLKAQFQYYLLINT